MTIQLEGFTQSSNHAVLFCNIVKLLAPLKYPNKTPLSLHLQFFTLNLFTLSNTIIFNSHCIVKRTEDLL